MTCTAIKVEKQGFDKSVATGEVIDFNGKKYVIIFIGKIRSYTYLKMPLIVATVVGQEIGSDNPQKIMFQEIHKGKNLKMVKIKTAILLR